MQADIFLSYAEEDRAKAGLIAERLGSFGWTVWWDRRIQPGKTWRETIESAIEGMDCMVVLWSQHSVESRWVNEEAEEALARNRLVPVLIEAVKPPMGFRSVQACDLTEWDGDSHAAQFAALTQAIAALAGEPPRPLPPPGKLTDSRLPGTGRRTRWLVAAAGALALIAASALWWGMQRRATPVSVPEAMSVPQSSGPRAARDSAPAASADSAPMPPRLSPAATGTTDTTVLPAKPKPPTATASQSRPQTGSRQPAAPGASSGSDRCSAILERLQLGEPVTEAERKECTR